VSEDQPTVEIPKGQPDQLRSAASRYTGIDQALSASETQLMNAPLSVSSWQGRASTVYALVAAEHADAVRRQRGSVQAARVATDDYADALADARSAARAAKEEEREAIDLIAKLKVQIADEQDAQQTATAAIAIASIELAADALTGGAASDARGRLSRATEALQASQDREARLRTRLGEQRDALTRARRRGDRATEQAQSAAIAYAAGMEAATGVPPMVAAIGPPARSLGGGQRTTLRTPRDIKPQPTGPSPGSDPFSGFDPISALGWGITGATGGYVNRAEGARKARRGANERLTRASDPSRKLTESGYNQALRDAERGASEGSGAARAASKGLKFAKPLGPITDVGTGVYDAASGQKGWLRSGVETGGSIVGGVLGGAGAGLLAIESGPGAVVAGAAGATGGSALGKSGAGALADALGID